MTIQTNVEHTKENLLSQLDVLAEMFVADYNRDTQYTHSEANYSIHFEFGSKYIKIIKRHWGSKSVAGFIVNSHNAKFPYGTLLKAASYKAPALNFSRGNIFELQDKHFSWTGII